MGKISDKVAQNRLTPRVLLNKRRLNIPMVSEKSALLEQIEHYCQADNIAESTFGFLAVNHAHYFRQVAPDFYGCGFAVDRVLDVLFDGFHTACVQIDQHQFNVPQRKEVTQAFLEVLPLELYG